VNINFKSITINKDAQYTIRYTIEEAKGDAIIKSTVSIALEDAQLHDGMTLADIVEKSIEIAKKTYLYKN